MCRRLVCMVVVCALWDVAAISQAANGGKKPLAKEQLDAFWKDLADADAAKAYQAIQQLATAPKEAVPFLKATLKPIPRVDPKVLEQLFVDLNNDKFSIRDKATFELEKLGDLALPDLQKRLMDNPTLEMRQRMEKLLSKLQGPVTSPEVLRMLRASEALERMGTPEALQLLEAIATGAPGHRLTEDARDAVKRLKELQANAK
jgi:HEAT repeat protein